MNATARITTPSTPPGRWRERAQSLLSTSVSGASLAVLRIAVGLVMILESISIFLPSESSGGLSHLDVYYTGQGITFNFPYEGFGWLPLLPTPWFQLLCGLMGLAAFSMALGFQYRLSTALTFLAWGYLYAVESTRTYWMSYYYLELLVLFLLLWMPASACFSVDAWRKGTHNSGSIPFWPIALLRGQLVITYFYAGLAKVNHDWLFDGIPMRIFLEKPWVAARLKSLFPEALAGSIDQAVHSPLLIHFLGWSGAAFDLAVGFLLIFRRTRVLGMVLLVLFHSFNHFILFTDIVWFPLLGIATAPIFLEPNWPLRLVGWLRKPRIPRPDLPWLIGGALALPLVGAALGWRLAPNPNGRPALSIPLRRWTLPWVAFWIAVQTLIPLRHFLIAGDGRFTFEGLPWSWRLKTEYYRCTPGRISVEDPTLRVPLTSNPTGFQWEKWPGEKVLYRPVNADRLDWAQLPELVVLLEPMTGERILYNAQSGSITNHSEAAARLRIATLWKDLYGRAPDSIARTVPVQRILEGYERSMRGRGHQFRNQAEVFATLDRLNGRGGDGAMMPVLRRSDPLALSGAPPSTGVFLLIEDRKLFRTPPARPLRLDPSAWRNGPAGVTAIPATEGVVTPCVVLHTDLSDAAGELLPRYYAADATATSDRPVEIRWNLFRDVGQSKGMHVSMQPFLLRRYARRIATFWETTHGHRPAVHAVTEVSLNERPAQAIVDREADLASVSTTWFGHNAWIRDLEPGRPIAAPAPKR